MNDKLTATITVVCAGCHKTITCPYEDFQFQVEKSISQEGWIRRDFDPHAKIWFCSPECAYGSIASRQYEEWWKHHNQQSSTISIVRPLLITLTVIVFTLACSFALQYLLGV